MRTFLEGCLVTLAVIVTLALAICAIVGGFLFVLWGADKYPGYTLLAFTGVCVIGGGVEAWWNEREELKRWQGGNE